VRVFVGNQAAHTEHNEPLAVTCTVCIVQKIVKSKLKNDTLQ